MYRSRVYRLFAALLSSAIAAGVIVDIVDEYPTEPSAYQMIVERAAVTSPQLESKFLLSDANELPPPLPASVPAPAPANQAATSQTPAQQTQAQPSGN